MSLAANPGEVVKATAKPGRCGKISLWLALAAFCTAVVGTVILLSMPRGRLSDVSEAINITLIVVVMLGVPLTHLLGLGFGIAALIRRNERLKLGVLGTLLNGGALCLAITFIGISLRGITAFR